MSQPALQQRFQAPPLHGPRAAVVADFATAGAELDTLDAGERRNLYEDAWLWLLKSAYLDAMEPPDAPALVLALQRAIGGTDSKGNTEIYLEPELFVAATRRLYGLHLERGELGAAVETFERLRDTEEVRSADNYEAALGTMRQTYDRILAAAATEQLIVVKAEIDEYHYWLGKLLRRSFGLASVVGRVDTVDIRCEKGTTRVGFSTEDQLWTIPQSWGDCRLYVKGEPGTTFSLREYPAGYAAADAASTN